MLTLYKLEFPNGKLYIGGARDLRKRWRGHRSYALGKRSAPVHKAIRKFGLEAVRMVPLAIGPAEYIFDLEIRAISAFNLRDRKYGYNVCVGGKIAPTKAPIVAQKVASKNKGRSPSDETRAKISAAGRGRKHSPESIARMSVAQKGRIVSDDAKAKLRVAHTGKKASAETREKMRAAKLGKPSGGKGFRHSDETRAKLCVVRKGHPVSSAQREKVRAALSGRALSEETKAKLSIAQTARRIRERASSQPNPS